MYGIVVGKLLRAISAGLSSATAGAHISPQHYGSHLVGAKVFSFINAEVFLSFHFQCVIDLEWRS